MKAMIIPVPAARLRRALTILVVVFIALSYGGAVLKHSYHSRVGDLLVRIFNVGDETSIPNWYSSVALAGSAALLACVAATLRARKETKDLTAWAALSAIFALLSLDEIVGMHELFSEHLHEYLHTSGAFRFAWAFPALVLVLFVGATYLPMLSRLTLRRRVQFIVAGLIYVGGAVGMEMVGSKVFSAAGDKITPMYIVCNHLEEFMEMFGIVLFNAALIEHLASLLGNGGLNLRFADD